MRDQPVVQNISERLWKLAEDCTYEWHIGDKKFSITVKAGFITDLASVPIIFWSLGFTPTGLVDLGSVVHDALYNGNGTVLEKDGIFLLNGQPFTGHFTRNECDRLFLRINKESGLSYSKRYIMYWALYGFGWIKWNQFGAALKKQKNKS